MRRFVCRFALVTVLALGSTADAATFRFDTDPFANSTAPTTQGRQIVGGEDFIEFEIASDVFSFDPSVFGVGDQVAFFNGLSGAVPPTGVNVIVLQNADVPFAAGIAADLIADRVTTPGPGFFIYFNSGLDLPRLVFSADLSDSTADLKILARMTNLSGLSGRDALPTFTAANFELVPEPASLALMAMAVAAGVRGYTRRRRRERGC